MIRFKQPRQSFGGHSQGFQSSYFVLLGSYVGVDSVQAMQLYTTSTSGRLVRFLDLAMPIVGLSVPVLLYQVVQSAILDTRNFSQHLEPVDQEQHLQGRTPDFYGLLPTQDLEILVARCNTRLVRE
jgi:hypothetical protein